MTLFIDADGCPVIDIAIDCAQRRGVDVMLVCDTAHHFDRDGATTITVSKGADSADFYLVNKLHPGDIVITQDYGLAAMSLSRRAKALNQNGLIYTSNNIDSLLASRHTARKIRMSGGRIKGPAKRDKSQDAAFLSSLESMLDTR